MTLFKASEALEKSKMNKEKNERALADKSLAFVDVTVAARIKEAVSVGNIMCKLETNKSLDFGVVCQKLRELGYSVNTFAKRASVVGGGCYTPVMETVTTIEISWL